MFYYLIVKNCSRLYEESSLRGNRCRFHFYVVDGALVCTFITFSPESENARVGEWANGSSIWNSRSKLSRRSVLEIDVMSARTRHWPIIFASVSHPHEKKQSMNIKFTDFLRYRSSVVKYSKTHVSTCDIATLISRSKALLSIGGRKVKVIICMYLLINCNINHSKMLVLNYYTCDCDSIEL